MRGGCRCVRPSFKNLRPSVCRFYCPLLPLPIDFNKSVRLQRGGGSISAILLIAPSSASSEY